MNICVEEKIKVKLSAGEKLKYNSYLAKIDAARTTIEVDTYYFLAKQIIDTALDRQKILKNK